MIKYRIYISQFSVNIEIKEIEAERETGKSVWIKGHRFSKNGYYEFYNTWEEAYERLKEIAQKFVHKAEKNLESKKKDLKEIKELKK